MRARTGRLAAAGLIAVLLGALAAAAPAAARAGASPPAAVTGAVAAARAGVRDAGPPGHPSAAQCRAIAPARSEPASGTASAHASLRVIGIQYLQAIPNVVSYSTFRRALACLMQEYVVPLEVAGRPTLVVLNEDIGLMAGLVGSRGATARALAETYVDGHELGAPVGDEGPAPVGAASALGLLNAGYAPQEAAYDAMFGPIDPRKAVFVAATDTFVRAFVIPMSQIAEQYGVYLVGSADMAPYRETSAPAQVAVFGDPSVHDGVAYVATSQQVYNTTFLWGPRPVHPAAPDGERNLLFQNEKVPLTSLETQLLDLDEGPSTGAAAIRNADGYTVAGLHLGFATSLPAFTYGYAYGARPPAHPCADTAVTYMACMNSLGVDTVIQAEANPGRWAADAGDGVWQPLEWMESSWRAVTDPSVRFRYAVNPMMVGNLFDLAFDGQSAIVARGVSRGRGRSYVGDSVFLPGTDPAADRVYSGPKPNFLALAPWVLPAGSRAALMRQAALLAPGSGSPQEDQYVQTAVYADLVASPARSAARHRA